MPTLLLRLAGPMQSWGTSSRFTERDTGSEPSKSGLLGLLCAALGIDRSDWPSLEPLSKLRLGIRHDRPGVPKYDYQSAAGNKADAIIKADGKLAWEHGVISKRHYLADAIFLAGFEGEDSTLLASIQAALKNPIWPIFLGRKSYIPSETVWLPDGVREGDVESVLSNYPWLGGGTGEGRKPPPRLTLSLEATTINGAMRMDQPLGSFAERRFGSRYVVRTTVPCSATSAQSPVAE